MRILAICTSIEFLNRATIEAINAKYECIDVLCQRHIRNYFRRKTKSEKVKIDYLHTVVPGPMRDIFRASTIDLRILNLIWKGRLKAYDTVFFTSPFTAFFLPLLTDQKIIYLIHDPFLLMNNHSTYLMERQLLERADVVLTTSKLLKDNYVWKYFQKQTDNVFYWPNTVDLSIWDYKKMQAYRRSSAGIVIGYAGNMNEITTDLSLLDELTTRYNDCRFEFAGHLNFNNTHNLSKMRMILAKPNVRYLGFISYNDIPKIVVNWNICLMLDVQSEISGYVHHNKIYQYLALGKPVVVQRTHRDYEELSSVVYLCDTKKEFFDKVAIAATRVTDREYSDRCIHLARLNSSDSRAVQFMEIMNRLRS
jgi:hypothetical protein